jgi:hypothetical protein
VYLINDNEGNDFTFLKHSSTDVWINEDAFEQARKDLPTQERRGIQAPPLDQSNPEVRALASVATTDVLSVGISNAPVGLCLNPAVAEARAGWFSFGYLVRRAATVSMDVAESELNLGIQPILDFSSPFAPPSARIFLSDALENGAGYCTHLGDPDRFERLLELIVGTGSPANRTFVDPLVSPGHADECQTSCPRCLRDYGNMAYHPLLDWRTGLDMARLALDANAQVDLHQPYWADLLYGSIGFADQYFNALELVPDELGGLPAGLNTVDNEVVILVHPLWDQTRSNLRSDVAAPG